MNYIFMSKNCISAVTNSIEAEPHKHLMLQFFMSCSDNLNIKVKDENISCKCIIVDTNVEHCFYTGDAIHFTMLIEPTSHTARKFREQYIKQKGYYVIESYTIELLQAELRKLVDNLNEESYTKFFLTLFSTLGIKHNEKVKYDERIFELFEMLDNFDCSDYSLQHIASDLSLSVSRISHLFKEQTGIALKSYIVLHKLQKAYIQLFRNGNITEAAMAGGFDSPSHFAYTNKNLTGMSAKNIMKDSVFYNPIIGL